MTKEDIIQKISNILSEKGRCIVAIDGTSASGKTTLGEELQQRFSQSTLFHMDDYFLQPHQRTKERLHEIGGNVDYERFYLEVISHLSDEGGFDTQRFDCQTQTLNAPVHYTNAPLIIIEGAYSQHPYFGDVYDLRIVCEVTPSEQEQRIILRNGVEKWQRFVSEWIPKEQDYLEHFHIKNKSELLH